MKIKLGEADTARLLWRESPCTLSSALVNPYIDKAKRFHYGSIYFRDEVNRPKKVFTEFQKPELLLLNFRRQIEEVSLRARKSAAKSTEGNGTASVKKGKRKQTVSMQNRLYERPVKIDLLHDRHGNRSSYVGDYDVKQITERVRSTRRNFYSSQRMDLSKPDNFFPGPGSYFQGEEGQKMFRHTCMGRLRGSSVKQN